MAAGAQGALGRGRGVRITGGALRGRAAKVPPGVRPTEGRVREALFSIWRDRLAGCRFLDLFAGSGVVALEAAGRGARCVLAIDQDAQAVRTIAANAANATRPARPGEDVLAAVETRRLTLPAGLAALGSGSAGEVGRAGGAGAGTNAAAFDLVFADPPYRFDDFEPLLLALPPLLAGGAEIAVEHSARRRLPSAAGPLVQCDLRRYGESAVAFYRARE
jgi:16S rRNA (guanine966-N2)-methyltransferase